MVPPSPAPAAAAPLNLRAVAGLGLSQVYAWGAVYYPISLTAKPIAADLGLSREFVFLGFTLVLIVSALVAPWVGRAIDRFGGRIVMTAGALVAAAALAALGAAQGPVSYLAASALSGLAAALTLYDAAFAALVQVAGAHGRRAITYVTFFGGFASTIFWPLTALAMERYGWRETYFLYAAGALFLCLPLNFLALKPAPADGDRTGAAAPEHERDGPPLRGADRRRAFVLVALSISAHQLVIAGLTVHLVGAMAAAGLSEREAIIAGMMFGPAQVLSRIGEMMFGARLPAVAAGRVAVALLPLALALVLTGRVSLPVACVFVAGCGLSNGLMTIARGAVSLAIFGRQGYGAAVGDIALANQFSRAMGPLAFAFALTNAGLGGTFLACMACALIAVAAMEAVARIDARRRGVANPSPETGER